MLPTGSFINHIQALIAADATGLADTDALHVHLIKSAFTPTQETALADLTQADFGGYADIAAEAGTQQTFRDPVTGQLVIQMEEPVGGWHWQATSGANLPQTIYGFVLTDNADAVTYGSQLLDTPVTLTDSGDAVDIGQVRFNIVDPPME